MAGRVQLETSGPQDRFFTVDPDYTHFLQSFRRHSNYSTEYVYMKPENEADFGKKVKFTIPQNQGDLIKTLSVKVTLPALTSSYNIGYIESIGHALIEYADIIIGGKVVQRITSDYLQIYSEHNFTQTKQKALEKLIGKYSLRTSATRVSDSSIIGFLGKASTEQQYFIDLPFYFYRNPKLAIPICAITKQEVEIEIKLRDYTDLIIDTSDGTYKSLTYKPSITNFQLCSEIVFVDICERVKIKTTKRDYTITQLQQNVFDIDQNVSTGKFKLSFINPVKELYFIIQRQNVTPFDYDNTLLISNDKLVLYENLDYLNLTLDGEDIITEETGNVIFLKAVQGAIHHSKTQLIRRFYSYSFACEPEQWYPTGQVNFSLTKEQIINLSMTPCVSSARQFRVYALSYNILRVNEGIAQTLFNSQ
jgi:hypothetical protein